MLSVHIKWCYLSALNIRVRPWGDTGGGAVMGVK